VSIDSRICAVLRLAAASFLAALGIDVDHEDLQETPARMARAYAELFSSAPLRLTTFANDEGYDELVLARSIPFRTVCEHHLLPFSGVAHVGYLPGERIVGLSKLARLVEHFASRPQTQERLTVQIADALAKADAVAVADIWAGRDTDLTVVSAADLATAVAAVNPAIPVLAPGSVEATADALAREVRSGDAVLVMGGGASYRIGERLLERLETDG
jgi:GTP cyclohydrolase I